MTTKRALFLLASALFLAWIPLDPTLALAVVSGQYLYLR